MKKQGRAVLCRHEQQIAAGQPSGPLGVGGMDKPFSSG